MAQQQQERQAAGYLCGSVCVCVCVRVCVRVRVANNQRHGVFCPRLLLCTVLAFVVGSFVSSDERDRPGTPLVKRFAVHLLWIGGIDDDTDG